MSELHRFDDADQAARAAARCVLDALGAALEDRKKAFLAVSGGSTPRKMFEAMADAEFRWDGVKVFFVDERMVGPDDPDSNYRMAREALFEPAGLDDSQVFRILGELEPHDAAERYLTDLRKQFKLKDDELPRFDVIHLGMGSDAHTASLFPGEPLLGDREAIAAAVYAGSKESYRVTLLPGVLLRAETIVFLVAGEDKAEPLRRVRQGAEAVESYPAQVVERHAKNVHWFVDRAAAPE